MKLKKYNPNVDHSFIKLFLAKFKVQKSTTNINHIDISPADYSNFNTSFKSLY